MQAIRAIQTNLRLALSRQQYRNLVFKGGGVRGIAYMGAVEALDDLGMLAGIERVAGTSAGAIAAMVVSFRLSAADTKALFNTIDFRKVPQRRTSSRRPLIAITEEQACYSRFFRDYGWYASQYFYGWLQQTIAGQCDGNGRATFADFRQRGFRDLYVVASNLTRQRAEVFSASTTPDVAVADAVRMSTAIPIFFESLRFDGKAFGQGDYYVDGGVYDNFPMHVFDHRVMVDRPFLFRNGANWETLGLFLHPDPERSPVGPAEPADVWQYLTLTLRNIYTAHETATMRKNPIDRRRAVEISDCGIPAIDFDITIGDDKYCMLYHSGKTAVRQFFGLEPQAPEPPFALPDAPDAVDDPLVVEQITRDD